MRKGSVGIFCLVMAAGAYGQGKEQEVLGGLQKASDLVKAGQYRKAISELQFSIGQLQELVMAEVVDGFQKIFSPWVAERPEQSQAGMAFLGGGFNVKLTYRNPETDEIVELEAVGNSPLIQTMSMWMSNPMFLGQGRSLVRLGKSGDYKAVFTEKDRTLQLIQGNNLFTWKGVRVNKLKETLVRFGHYYADHHAPLLKEALGE